MHDSIHGPPAARSRRDFLALTVAAASASTLGCAPATPPAAPPAGGPDPAALPRPSRGKKSLLVLGGTKFLGPAVVEAARARGYAITLFNRGKTRPELFPDVEKLHGDRDPDKGDGLKALQGRKWDAVIDTSGFFPRLVKASAQLLAPNVGQYVYISSVSVYEDESTPHGDETGAVRSLADPTVETMGAEFENYGGLKALCEKAVETALPGRATNVRPGFIVGPDDTSDRFTYWPVRVAQGGEVLAPGAPSDPIQIIDVRDLGEWLVALVDQATFGVFDAVGPGEPLTMGGVLDISKTVSGSDASFTWVSAEFIESLPGEPVDLPIWTPAEGKTKGFHSRSGERARKAGLKFRPVKETVKDTLAFWRSLPAERQAKPHAGLSRERESEILAAWKQKKQEKAGKPDRPKP